MEMEVTALAMAVLIGCGSSGPEAEGDAASSDVGSEWDASATWPDHPLLTWEPLNIAHRGGGDERPEHTLLAYEHALDVGADVLELDVHLTSDDVVVVMHDVGVSRTTDGDGLIAEMTLAELKALDAGYDFLEGDTYPYRGMGLEVPTLEEVFEAYPDAYFAIELKIDDEDLERGVADLIFSRGMQRQVTVGSLLDASIMRFRMLAPEVPTTFAANEIIAFNSLSPSDEPTYVPPAPIALVPSRRTTAEVVARTHRLGMYMRAYTVDDEAEMESLLDVGAMAIITNRPTLLQGVFDRRGI